MILDFLFSDFFAEFFHLVVAVLGDPLGPVFDSEEAGVGPDEAWQGQMLLGQLVYPRRYLTPLTLDLHLQHDLQINQRPPHHGR